MPDELEDTELQAELQAESQEGEQEGEQNTPIVNETEEKARRMGWKPQDEYKGDPDRWTDAESFVKVGEERIPVMKENYRKLEDNYKALEQKVKAQEDYQKHMAKVQYERAIKDLKEQKKVAVEEADTDKYEKLEKQEEQIKTDYSPKQPDTPRPPDEVANWIARNTWYQNPTLANKAAEIENKILEEEALNSSDDPFYQPKNTAERLEEVSRRIRAEFKKEPARKLPAVEGARMEPSKKASKTYNDLPPEAKQACNNYVKANVLSREEYVKSYFGE